MISKLEKGNNHHYVGLVKEISSLSKNELSSAKYSLLGNIFGPSRETTASKHSTQLRLDPGLNMDFIDHAAITLKGLHVNEASDGARCLRKFGLRKLNNKEVVLLGNEWNPDVNTWYEQNIRIPWKDPKYKDPSGAMKSLTDLLIKDEKLDGTFSHTKFWLFRGCTEGRFLWHDNFPFVVKGIRIEKMHLHSLPNAKNDQPYAENLLHVVATKLLRSFMQLPWSINLKCSYTSEPWTYLGITLQFGTKSTKGIISEMQGNTTELQSLNAQPAFCNTLDRSSKAQFNQMQNRVQQRKENRLCLPGKETRAQLFLPSSLLPI